MNNLIITSLYRSLFRATHKYSKNCSKILQNHIRNSSKNINLLPNQNTMINLGFKYLHILNNDEKSIKRMHGTSTLVSKVLRNKNGAPSKEEWMYILLEDNLLERYLRHDSTNTEDKKFLEVYKLSQTAEYKKIYDNLISEFRSKNNITPVNI